jgi:hypothetical protein
VPRSLVSVATLVLVVALSNGAHALLKPGTVPKDFVVHNADDKAAKFSLLRAGHPTIVFYEDKDGGDQNERLKQRIGELRKKSPSAKRVALVAIADVKSWDFWPAKGFVKDALRSAGKKAGIVVWADWSGGGRASLDASSNRSNVVLLDKLGKVVWASSGKLSTAQENEVLEHIQKLGA